MKNTEYKVIYLNGNEERFYCFGIWQAWATAVYHAAQKGWDSRIKSIYDNDHHTSYSGFNLTYDVK